MVVSVYVLIVIAGYNTIIFIFCDLVFVYTCNNLVICGKVC